MRVAVVCSNEERVTMHCVSIETMSVAGCMRGDVGRK